MRRNRDIGEPRVIYTDCLQIQNEYTSVSVKRLLEILKRIRKSLKKAEDKQTVQTVQTVIGMINQYVKFYEFGENVDKEEDQS